VIGEVRPEFAKRLTNIDHVGGDPSRLVTRMIPLVRMHAFEGLLKRMLKTLDTDSVIDPQTGLLTRESFWHDLQKAIEDASDRSLPLSVGRFTLKDGELNQRASMDGARLAARFTRNIDFATREDDGAILIAFTQTDLQRAHVVARRIAGSLKNMPAPTRPEREITANVTLATLKAGDTLDSLMMRVMGARVVAAE
jgi:PleD family two-component response regulator